MKIIPGEELKFGDEVAINELQDGDLVRTVGGQLYMVLKTRNGNFFVSVDKTEIIYKGKTYILSK